MAASMGPCGSFLPAVTCPSCLNLISFITEETWRCKIESDYDAMKKLAEIEAKLAADYANGVQVYPPQHLIFNALNLTPLDKIKVVILGQDPYTTPGQAMGLAFSVPQGVTVPPSLRNIFKALQNDAQIINFTTPNHGDLTAWAQRGVFLLNSTLTVGIYDPNNLGCNANSHSGYGWLTFTDMVIKLISDNREGVVFILMGNNAHTKADLIDANKHTVIKPVHPAAHGSAFQNCNCFSKANVALEGYSENGIVWSL